MHTITIWSDIACPWSYVACMRLHRMRDAIGADDVEFDFRARPAEIADPEALDPLRVRAEMAVLAQLEHTAFSVYGSETWPGTLIPAFEAQKWGYSLSQDIGERFDLALRRGMFLHGHDLSQRSQLLAIAESEGLEAAALAAALDSGKFRQAVHDDAGAAAELDIAGTPVVVMPDGTAHLNPGITVEWLRGLPILHGDHPSVYEEILRDASFED